MLDAIFTTFIQFSGVIGAAILVWHGTDIRALARSMKAQEKAIDARLKTYEMQMGEMCKHFATTHQLATETSESLKRVVESRGRNA